jgi:non-specific serine/threonine protein kinase
MDARIQHSLSARGATHALSAGRGADLSAAIRYALDEEARPAPVNISGSDSPFGAALTKRQVAVARLVAQGLTNREIASRLFISDRTAEGHVEQIRNKLGFTSRAQVAAWAAQHLPQV